MRRFWGMACLLGSISGTPLMAQEGPLLVPPAPGETGENGPQRGDQRRTFGDTPSYLPYVPETNVRRADGRDSLPADPAIRQVAIWYRELLDRDLSQSEQRNWQTYLSQRNNSLEDVPAMVLGSEEFFEKSGGRYESWLVQVGEEIGQPVGERELQRWSDEYRRHRDRIDFTRRFLEEQGQWAIGGESVRRAGYQPTAPRPGDAGFFPEDYGWQGHGAGGFYDNRSGSRDDPWHLSPFSPYEGGTLAPPPGLYDHPPYQGGRQDPYRSDWNWAGSGDRHHGGGRPPFVGQPAARSEADLIAEWYRTYFGRDIAQWELRKWLSDLEGGMPLGEVFASVLASKEWIERSGGNPRQWIAATLAALGQRDPAAVEAWYGRFRELDGDRLELTKEMVRRFGIRPRAAVGGTFGHVGHDHDNDDDDRDRRRRERRRERFDDDD